MPKNGEKIEIIGKGELTFPYASKRYDYINGEIADYSPEKILKYGKRIATPLYTNYSLSVKAGPKIKLTLGEIKSPIDAESPNVIMPNNSIPKVWLIRIIKAHAII